MNAAASTLPLMLKALRLPSITYHYQRVAVQAAGEGWSFDRYLTELVELEVSDREQRRTERQLRRSGLPEAKTLATLNTKLFPLRVQRQLPVLCDGGFVQRTENILIFGLPGRGKSHIATAIARELVLRHAMSALFSPTHQLVERLLVAKQHLELEKELKKLDRFDVVVLDDIGYVQQNREEMEVLFTFLAERYERRSLIITSNLVFSEWDKIFKDPMTTAAAIDRLVHHATILELDNESYRATVAQQRSRQGGKTKTEKRQQEDTALSQQ